jgi:protein-disulfide isomerase
MSDQAHTSQKEYVTIKVTRSTFKLLAFVVLAFALGFFIGNGFTFTGQATATAAAPTAPTQPSAPSAPSVPSNVALFSDEDPFEGNPEAPVIIVEFSDFQCPFCGRFYTESLGQIKSQYVDTGKVKFIYRDFPLASIHPQAQSSAEAAQCALEQGNFWDFHDILFERQGSLSPDNYKTWASELGLDAQQFSDCFDSGKHRASVQTDFSEGSAAGVSGTPTFFIGNEEKGFERVVGAQPFSVLQQVIESKLL